MRRIIGGTFHVGGGASPHLPEKNALTQSSALLSSSLGFEATFRA
jgi:hypothetical protein